MTNFRACSGFYLIVDLLEASMVVRPYNTNTKLNGIVNRVKNAVARLTARGNAGVDAGYALAAA